MEHEKGSEEACPAASPRNKHRSLFGSFIVEGQVAVAQIVNLKLNLTEMRTWFILVAYVEKGNIVKKQQKFLAEKIGVAPQNLSKAIKSLIQHDMVCPVESPKGEGWQLMLSPFYVWKGDWAGHEIGMRRFAEWSAKTKAAAKAKAKAKEKAKAQAIPKPKPTLALVC